MEGSILAAVLLFAGFIGVYFLNRRGHGGTGGQGSAREIHGGGHGRRDERGEQRHDNPQRRGSAGKQERAGVGGCH